jgi:hypothetical protein
MITHVEERDLVRDPAGDKVCDHFEFDETQNNWMKIVPNIKLIFLILEM